jgi:hypothetical protein
MAKFCTKCGRPLQEGEICSCQVSPVTQTQSDPQQHQPEQPPQQHQPQQPLQQYQQPPQQYQQQYRQQYQQYQQPNYNIPAAPAKPNALVIYFRILGQCIKAYFNDASETLKQSASHGDIKTGLSLAAVNCLFVGFFLMAIVNSFFRAIYKISSGLAMTSSIKFPHFELFLLAFVFAAAVYFGICVIGLLVGSITGKQAPFKAFMASIGVATLPSAIVMIPATIFAFFWLQGATVLMLIALFTWLISTYAAIKATLDITDAKISIYYGLFSAVLLGIIYLIASGIVPSVMRQISIG